MGYIEDLRAMIGHTRVILNGSLVIISNTAGEVLMQERKYPHGSWGLPGGLMELGESTEQTARREVMEETGLSLGQLSLFGVYSGEGHLSIAHNGDEFYLVTTVYTTSEYRGAVYVNDDESLSFAWKKLDQLPESTVKTHQKILSDYAHSVGA